MHKQAGFTMIELLVTMTVAVVLTSIAVPSFKLTFQNNRLVSQSNDLLGAMLYARSEAIALNTNVTVCASNDAATCSGTNWAKGWITKYTDSTGTVQTLRIEPSLSGGNTLTSTFGSSIVFQKDGTITAGAAGTFNLCDARLTSNGRSLWITATGLTRLSTNAGKKLDGSTMSC